MKLSDYKLGNRMFAFWKGEPGTGKTCALADVPGAGWIADFDDRIEPLRKICSREDIEIDSYTAFQMSKFDDKWEKLKEIVKYGKPFPYNWICVDSLTRYADAAIRYSKVLRGVDPSRKTVKGIFQLNEIEDYGVESEAIISLLEEAQTFPCHFILTGHVLESEQRVLNEEKPIKTRRILTGGNKISPRIPTYFNEIWHFYAKPGGMNSSAPPRRSIITANAGEDFAKTAWDLPQEIGFDKDKPLFPKILTLLKERNIILKGCE